VGRFIRDAVLTVIILVVIGCIVVYAMMANGGLSAVDQPGRFERAVAGRLVTLAIPSDAKTAKNPFAGNADAWRDAEDHYGDHCATCHGKDGRGQTDLGKYMYPKAPDLASASVQHLSDGALFYIIQNGVRWTGMPGWKTEHTPEETWKLVSYMRHIPQIPPAPPEEEHEHAHGHHEEPKPPR
jgi:mono/diheme cytochrome c family protein